MNAAVNDFLNIDIYVIMVLIQRYLCHEIEGLMSGAFFGFSGVFLEEKLSV